MSPAYTSAQDMRLEPKCRHEGGLRLRGICKAAEPDMPLITILTVVYNRARYLRRAIESVLSQDYHNIEYIVIDGGSTDSSLDIVKEYDHAIDYWVSEPDQGMYYALNKGIELSNGTLIGLMHSDDFLLRRDAIGIVAKVAGEKVADIYHTDALLIVEKVDRCELQLMHSDDTKILQTHASILHPSSFVRKQVFKDIGSYDVRYRSASDYEFFIRCVRRERTFLHIDQVLYGIWNSGEDRVSHNCYSHLEVYRFHKEHQTGHHRQYIYSYVNCNIRQIFKRLLSERQIGAIRRLLHGNAKRAREKRPEQ